MKYTSSRAALARAIAFAPILGALMLAACGGGGSAPTPTPTSANAPPQIAGGNPTASVVENSVGTALTVSASDADGDSLSYSLGGTDADRFTIASNGEISFVSAPNYDLPGDADADNIYRITINVSDGKATSSVAGEISVTNDRENVGVALISATGDADLVVSPIEGSKNLLLVRGNGAMSEYNPDTGTVTLYKNAFEAGETGRVWGAIKSNLWVLVLMEIDGRGVFLRLHTAATAGRTLTEERLAEAVDPSVSGSMFSTSGGWFAALGAISGEAAQDSASGFGKLYSVGFDPYCGASLGSFCISARIVGDGIHDPAGGGEHDGKAFLFDRGTDKEDEASLFDFDSSVADFMWPFYEGGTKLEDDAPPQVNPPFLTFARGTGFGESTGLSAGAVYNGSVASLAGKLVFADESGKVLALDASAMTEGTVSNGSNVEDRTLDFNIGSGETVVVKKVFTGTNGRLYLLDSQGTLYRLIER